MCRLRTFLPTEGLIMYYNGYILPLFHYCCTVWGETTNLNIEKLCKLQKLHSIYNHIITSAPSMYLFHIFIQLNVNVRYGIRREVYNGIICIQI
jgi:hypothetical protein